MVEAADVLTQVRQCVVDAVADAAASAKALRGEGAQARRRSGELLDEAIRLTEVAERLVVEARAIQGERTATAPPGSAHARG